MAISFKIETHSVKPGVQIVEVLEDDKVIATIYPEEKGVKIVSAHIADIFEDKKPSAFPPIPSITVTFNPGPYTIVGGETVKLPNQ